MKERFEVFTVLINRLSRNIRKLKIQEMSEYNLRSAHVSCLYYIYASEKTTATDLCEKCEEDKATVSRSLDYLEKNGFIRSSETNAKRYKNPIILTEKGMAAGKKITEKIDMVLSAVDRSLTDEERNEFYRHLATISTTLEKLSKNDGK